MAANTAALTWNQPENSNVPVWRYMDLPKFIDMLARKSLYFARPDTFSDPFEGVLSKKHNFPTKVRLNESAYEISIEEATLLFRKWSYVNCWHMNEHESAGMWKLYSTSNESVAVKTTYKNLVSVMPPSVEIGVVKYFDYDKGWSPPFGSASFTLMCKRRSFEYEREVRLVTNHGLPFNSDGSPNLESINQNIGLLLETDIASLIAEVYVSPDSDPWFRDVVNNVIEKFGYGFNVHQSRLSDVP